MRTDRTRSWIVLALLVCLGGAATLHERLRARDELYRPLPNDALYLPKPELFRATTLGFRQLAADLLWVKLVQAVGDVSDRSAGFKYIYQYTDIVTDVDPRYAAPYLIGNFWLVGWDRVAEANKLLEKGRKRFPETYKFPYYLGLNYFLWLHDRAKAIEYFSEAAKLRETPESWKRSVGRALDRPDDPEAAFELFLAFYTDAGNREEKQAMEPLVVHGLFYQLVTAVNGASEKFTEAHGRPPHTLEELVGDHLLRGVPKDPYGGSLYFDENGLIRSTARPKYWWDKN